MKNTLLFLAVFLAVGLADEVFTDMMKRHEPIVSTNKWAFSVAPKQEANRNPDAHVEQFPYYYSFCVPLSRLPAGEFTASLEIDFTEETDEVVVDFDFSGRSFDFVTKDSTQFLAIALHGDSVDQNGWSSEEGFSKPLSGRVYTLAPVGRVTLHGDGTWVETHDNSLVCHPKPEDENPQEGNMEDMEEDKEDHGHNEEHSIFPIPKKHYPIVIICVSFLMLFSILMCCCQCATVKISDEEDIITEMEQFYAIPQEGEPQEFNRHDDLIARNVEEMDEDEIMRRVQEQSRMEYESQNNLTVAGQREALSQYMQPPILTPEAYANFLSSQSQ